MSKKKKFGIFCVGLLGLFLMLYAGENLRGKPSWENFKKEWEAKGEVFDYKQIVPKAVPSEKNFAHIPLLKPLHQYQWSEDLSEATPVDQKSFDEAQSLLKLDSNADTKLDRWQGGQSVDLEPWQKMFRDQEGRPHPKEAGEPGADILQALGKFEVTMAELTQASKERPLCRYDIKYEAHFAALLPHLSPLRNFTKIFTLRALAHLANDDSEAALSDIQMSLFVSESIKDEPLLISQLVRIACLQIYLQPIWEGLKEDKWNAEQLADIGKQLAKIDLLNGYHISILGERDLANLAIDRMRDDPKLAGMLLEGANPAYRFIPDGWVYHNQRRLNEMHVKFSQRIVDPKARRIHPDIAVAFNKELDARTKRKLAIYDVLSGMVLPAIEKVAIKIGFAQAAVDHARIACLLELHKLEHKEYPAKLADLKAPLPNDPYTGKPYVYKPDPKGRYQIYGVGWNQIDDGGKVILKETDQLDLDKGDLIWSYSLETRPKGE
jgi:hypothetical protein|tara:strand:- start:799 stop:2277 length:1479 start_codon:yes stop_codon:yes gene_type:complete